MKLGNFAKSVDDFERFPLLPEGFYQVEIIKSETQYKKNDQSIQQAVLQYQVMNGEKKGQIIFEFFGLTGVSDKAQAFSRGAFGKIFPACGLTYTLESDTDDLQGGKMLVEVLIQPEMNGYPAKNSIKSYARLPVRLVNVDESPTTSKAEAGSRPVFAQRQKQEAPPVSDIDDDIPF